MTLHERITGKGEIENNNWRSINFFYGGYISEVKRRKWLSNWNRSKFKKFYMKRVKIDSQLKLFS